MRRSCADLEQEQEQARDQDPWIGARRAPRVPLAPAPNATNRSSPAAAGGIKQGECSDAVGPKTRGRRRTVNAGALHELQHL